MGLQEYLRQVLSQPPGPNAVPYAPQAKRIIEEHLVELQQVFPSLAVRLSDYHANDGRLLHLLKAEGTIPIHYQGSKYNIPVVIWLTAGYPAEAPLAYVVPTSTMVIKSGHAHVDRNGQVACNCLRGWNPVNTTLVSLCLEMSQLFGLDPPLFSQPPGGVSPPPAGPSRPAPGAGLPTGQPPAGYPGYSSSSYSVGSGAGPGASVAGSGSRPSSSPALLNQQGQSPYNYPPEGGGGGGGGFQQPPGFATPPPRQPSPQPDVVSSNPLWGAAFSVSRQNAGAEAAKQFRHLAIRALKTQVEAGERAWGEHVASETNALLEEQRALGERRAVLQAAIASLKAEREATEGLVSEMGGKQAQLVAWLERNEPKAAAWAAATNGGKDIDWDRALPAVDELSRQALETQAADLAVEDAVLALDKALLAGLAGLTLESYLKQVRALGRRQFFARALGLMVSDVQAQLPPPPPSRPGGPPGVSSPMPLVHGDSWSRGGHVPGAPQGLW